MFYGSRFDENKPSFQSSIASVFFWAFPLPESVLSLFLWCSNLQCIIVLLYIQVEFVSIVEPDTFSSALRSTAKFLSLRNFLTSPLDSAYTALILLAWIYFSLIFILLAVILVRARSKGQISKLESYVTCLLNQFHLALGFWLVNIATIPFIIDTEFSSDDMVSFAGTEVKEPFIKAICIVIVSINYIMTSFMAIFSYQPLKSCSMYATHTPVSQVLIFIFKAIILPIILFEVNFNLKAWFLVIFSFLWSAFKHYKLWKTLPYYHYSPMKHSILLSSITLMISCLNILVMALNGLNSIPCLDILFIELLLFPLILKVNNQYLLKVIQHNVRKKKNMRPSEDRIIRELFALTYLIDKPKLTADNKTRKELKELYTWALRSHLYCSTQAFGASFGTNQANLYQQVQVAFIEHIEDIVTMILLDSVKELRSNNKLKIILADHLSTRNGFSPLAITTLLGMTQQKGLNQIEALKIVKHIQEKLENFYQNGESTILNIKSFIDCQHYFQKLHKMVSTNTNKVLEFWTSYKEPKIKVLDLFLKSEVIEKEDAKLRQFWCKHIEPNRMFTGSLGMLYSSYLFLVRNAPHSAHKTLKLFKIFQNEKNHFRDESEIITRNNLNVNKDMCIYVSMLKETLGKILDVSPNVDNLVGWRREEVIRNDINIFLPEFMREKHSQSMWRHIESITQASKFTKNIDTFIRTREGFIRPCYFYLCIYPYIQQELVYIGVIRLKKQKNVDQIILNQQGVIEGFTIGIEPYIKELLVKRRVEVSFSLKAMRESLNKCKPRKISEAETSPPKVNSPRYAFDQSDHQSQKRSPRRMRKESSKVSLESKGNILRKQEKRITRHFRNHLINKSFYNFQDDMYVVLNLQKIINEQKIQHLKEPHLQRDQCKEETKNITIALDGGLEGSDTFRNALTTFRGLLNGNVSERILSNTKLHDLHNIKVKLETKENTRLDSNKTAHLDLLLSDMDSNDCSIGLSGEGRNQKILNSAFSSQKTSLSTQRARIEQAFYTAKIDRKIRILGFFLFGFITLPIFLLACFQAQNQKTLSFLEGDVNILNNQTLRLLNMINMNRIFVRFLLVDSGLANLDRFASFGISDLRFIGQHHLNLLVKDGYQLNLAIRNSLYKIDDNLRQRLYEKIPVVEDSYDNSSGIRYLNQYDLVSEIAAATRRIVSRPYTTLSSNDSDVRFVYHNTQNEILNSGERAIDVIVEDCAQKLDKNLRLIWTFSLIILGLVLFLVGFLLKITMDVLQDRAIILNIFLKLEKQILDEHEILLKSFSGLLERYSTNFQKLNIQLKKINPKRENNSFSKSSSYTKKEANLERINTRINKIWIVIFCLVCLILSGFITILVLAGRKNSEVSRKVNIMVTTNYNLYNLSFLFASVYEYIRTNATAKTHGMPITEHWEETMNKLTKIQDQFIHITDPYLGIGPNPILLEIIEGNLCKVIASDQYAAPQCNRMLYGIIQKGLIRLNSFMMALVQRTKLQFDSSSRSKQDMFDALNTPDLIQSEPATLLYVFPSYRLIGQLIKEQLYKDFKEYNENILVAIITFIVAFSTLGGMLCYRLKQALLYHKQSWRSMLRLMPVDMLKTNKLLIKYLLHSSLTNYAQTREL